VVGSARGHVRAHRGAFDLDGGSTTSVPVTIDVSSTTNQKPTVGLSSPNPGATFSAPATIAIAASAADPDGTVARVEFYSGSTLLGTDTTSPYSFSWTGVAAGSYTLKAIAYDNTGPAPPSARFPSRSPPRRRCRPR
jgi:hypothetical protein